MITIGSVQGDLTVNDIHHNQVVYLNGKECRTQALWADADEVEQAGAGRQEAEPMAVEDDEQKGGAVLPDVLATPDAMRMWEQTAEAGWTDAATYQPLVSRTKAALLAYEMARRLGIDNKWKTFEALWHRNNMRGDYNDAMEQRQSLAFRDRIKEALEN